MGKLWIHIDIILEITCDFGGVFDITSGSLWGDIGFTLVSTLGLLLGDFGVILISPWDRFAVTLGPFDITLRGLSGHFDITFGSVWDGFGIMLGTFRCFPDPFDLMLLE